MWSLVIAKDMFSRFDRAHLLAPPVAHRYRDTILAPGGSKPAASLVGDFLGRPFEFKAWEDWLNREEQKAGRAGGLVGLVGLVVNLTHLRPTRPTCPTCPATIPRAPLQADD